MKFQRNAGLFSAMVCCTLLATMVSAQQLTSFNPGQPWPDADGNHIQAHGGGIIKLGKTYYWYGEQRSRGARGALTGAGAHLYRVNDEQGVAIDGRRHGDPHHNPAGT